MPYRDTLHVRTPTASIYKNHQKEKRKKKKIKASWQQLTEENQAGST